MCRSLAQGGQRCSTHAQQKLAAAQTAYGNAIAVGMGNMNRIKRSYDRLVRAEQDYASTKEGRASLNALIADRAIPEEISTRLHNSLRVGEHLRKRNAAIAANSAHLDAQGLLPGGTATPGTQEALHAALSDMRANPDQYRTPTRRAENLVGVATYATQAEQSAGVTRWEREVDNAANLYDTSLRLLHRAGQRPIDVPASALQRATDDAVYLVTVSERLRKARAQNPPT